MADVLAVGFGALLGALGSLELVAAGSGRRGSPALGLALVASGATLAYVGQRKGAR